MISLDQIKALSDERAAQAAQDGLEPYVPFNAAEVNDYPPFPFPNIGSHEPKGWREINRLFVDSSGFGQPGELALTAGQLAFYVLNHLDNGYAIVQEGQFQVYVAVFERL